MLCSILSAAQPGSTLCQMGWPAAAQYPLHMVNISYFCRCHLQPLPPSHTFLLSPMLHPLIGLDALKPMSPLMPSSIGPQIHMSSEWDCEWEQYKCLAGNNALTPMSPSGTFKPGAIEGFWEGLFTVSCLHFASPVFVKHHLHVKPSPLGKHIVHQIHSICRITVWCSSTNTEQEPYCVSQSDLVLVRTPPLTAQGPG